MTENYRILIAEDQEIVATGVKAILDNYKNSTVVGVVNDGQKVLEVLKEIEVDLILMDINMPNMNGIQCTEKVKELHPNVKVVILTMYNRKRFIQELIQVGADGCVLKSNSGLELITAIDRVRENKTYFDQVNDFVDAVKEMSAFQLSDREIEIIVLITEGYTSREIGDRLFISEHTVKTHRKNIFRKVNVRDSDELVQFAMNNNLI